LQYIPNPEWREEDAALAAARSATSVAAATTSPQAAAVDALASHGLTAAADTAVATAAVSSRHKHAPASSGRQAPAGGLGTRTSTATRSGDPYDRTAGSADERDDRAEYDDFPAASAASGTVADDTEAQWGGAGDERAQETAADFGWDEEGGAGGPEAEGDPYAAPGGSGRRGAGTTGSGRGGLFGRRNRDAESARERSAASAAATGGDTGYTFDLDTGRGGSTTAGARSGATDRVGWGADTSGTDSSGSAYAFGAVAEDPYATSAPDKYAGAGGAQRRPAGGSSSGSGVAVGGTATGGDEYLPSWEQRRRRREEVAMRRGSGADLR
jgi:hypothetical protein